MKQARKVLCIIGVGIVGVLLTATTVYACCGMYPVITQNPITPDPQCVDAPVTLSGTVSATEDWADFPNSYGTNASMSIEVESPSGVVTTLVVTLDNLQEYSGPPRSASWDFSATFTPTEVGKYTYTKTATWTTGYGTETVTESGEFDVVDCTPPVITCPPDVTVEQESADGTVVEFECTATDNVDPNPTVTCVPASGSTFPLGTTTVTCTATDAAGHSSQCTFKVMVVDTTPPTIICPDDVTDVEQESPDGTVVPLTATATDICDSDPDITSTELAIYPLGVTTVTFTATDAYGNTASCSMTVTVVDTTPPTINSVLASPNVLWPPNHKMVEVTVTVDCTDICDLSPVCQIVNVTSNEPINDLGDGNTDPDWVITGDLTVDLRAERAGVLTGRVYTIHVECTDISGKTATATVDVTVPHDQGK